MGPAKPGLRAALPVWWRVARQWFTGSARWEARMYVLACTVLAVITTWLAVQISYTQKRFSTGLAGKDKDAWLAAVWEFVGIICLAAPLKALNTYAEKRLIAVWRAALTQALITAYTTNRAYFHLQLARGTEGEQSGGNSSEQQQDSGSAGDAADHDQAASIQDGSDKQGSSTATAAVVVAGLSDASACVDNPDQRITADVSNYVSTSVSLVLLLGKKLLNCAAFAGVLWSISPRLVTFLLCYAFMGTFGTAWLFGRPLTSLQQALLRLEADLRFGLVRLRENAEAVAFYSGDAEEAADLSSRLAAMIAVLLKRISWIGVYQLWVNTYSYATILIPSCVLAPEYFAGKIEFGTLTQASYAFTVLEGALGLILAKIDEFSSLAAETSRLAGLLAALEAADIDAGGSGVVPGFGTAQVTTPGPLAGVSRALGVKRKKNPSKVEGERDDSAAAGDDDASEDGEGTRLLSIVADGSSSNKLAVPGQGSSSNGHTNSGQQQHLSNGVWAGGPTVSRVLRLMDGTFSGLSVEELTAWVPGRHHSPTCVCKELTLSIGPGESLLVMGPSGCGKSSLLRVIAGLWTVGSGTVRGPAADRVFFLPQKPFMPLGSLRQQLLFPAGWKQQHLSSHNITTSTSSRDCTILVDNSSSSTDQRLQELLQAVNLAHLLHRFSTGLDAEVDWASVLSLGEQQRVALVRLLYHKPDLAFLDEATAALDPKTEAIAYRMVAQSCSSYVSIGHRHQLLEWHTHVLVSAGQGSWSKYPVAEFRQRLAAGLEG